MRISILIIIACFIALNSVSYAGGGRTGNAGDWRRMMFSSGQREAANWTNTASLNLNMIDFLEHVPLGSPLADFLLYPDALKRLAFDIMSSRHIYLVEEDDESLAYQTCAWTNDPTAEAMTDIVFTLPNCEGGLLQNGQNFATLTIIHESVHHLLRYDEFDNLIVSRFDGTPEEKRAQEEVFCDLVAEAIQHIFELTVLQDKPHWRDIALPVFGDEELWALQARGFHATAWTGRTGNLNTESRMIIWGGCQEGETTIYGCGDDSYFNDGAIYNPKSDEWTLMSGIDAPTPRAEMLSLWTGNRGISNYHNKLLVWGGCVTGDGCKDRLNDGGLFDPAQNKWTKIKSADDYVSPRVHHTGVWSGEHLNA